MSGGKPRKRSTSTTLTDPKILIPAIGAHAAAVLQERLTEQTVATANAADIGAVTLWCTPDLSHRSFHALVAGFGVRLARQPGGDLGARMLAAFAGPTLVIGTDCPALTSQHLRAAAEALPGVAAVIGHTDDVQEKLSSLLKEWLPSPSSARPADLSARRNGDFAAPCGAVRLQGFGMALCVGRRDSDEL